MLARDFIEELYEHIGYHPFWKYRTVFELVFDDGILQKESKRSESAGDLRRHLVATASRPGRIGMRPGDGLVEHIMRSYDRSYVSE